MWSIVGQVPQDGAAGAAAETVAGAAGGGENIVSHQVLEERVARLESDVGHMRDDLRGVSDGVQKLLERDARRPQALSWGQIGAAVVTTLSIMGGLWMLGTGIVEHSPAVVSLKERMDHAEWKYGWIAKVDK